MDLILLANQKCRRDFPVSMQRAPDPLNDNPTAMVPPHDIHCNSHRDETRLESLKRKLGAG